MSGWLLRMLAFALLVVPGAGAGAAQVVHVGGYEFPPYVESGPGGQSGLALDLVAAMNQGQDEYRFEFVPVSARRRYADLIDGRFDVMFFESPQWEWQARGLPVDFTRVILQGAEVYIAQARPGRDQSYFDSLLGKSLVGILGYHYGFAGFEGDPQVLGARYDIKLVSSHQSTIDLVLAGRRDVGVVTQAYLSRYLAQRPVARDQLLVSSRHDQNYEHRILVRRSGPISVEKIEAILDRLAKSGVLDQIWRNAGISN